MQYSSEKIKRIYETEEFSNNLEIEEIEVKTFTLKNQPNEDGKTLFPQ